MNQESTCNYLRALGERIWNEANDLKRTPEALADETGVSIKTVRAIISGKADESVALGLANKMTEIYPVSFLNILLEKDDTDDGVIVMRAKESKRTSRVFNRLDKTGQPAPYYEYRDTAMSRLGPFKPEWIRQLRVVDNADADNLDVAYNNGHLMHSLTFFVGEVNFYWKAGGKTHCRRMNTGDSHYITPYVPHTFTSRNSNKLGLIIATTYGDQVRQALAEFRHIGPRAADELAGNLRDAKDAFRARLARQLATESLSASEFVERLWEAGIERDRSKQLVDGALLPNPGELAILADCLYVLPSDLLVSALRREDEVVVRTVAEGKTRAYPNNDHPACLLTELARCRHQPRLKGFKITLQNGLANFEHSLHEYAYNYGDVPILLAWKGAREVALHPGDSAYIRPMVRHAYGRLPGEAEGHLLTVRTSGALSEAVINEYATYPANGRERASGENLTWF